MLINYYTRIDIGKRYGLGPLASYLSGFSEYLSQSGYAQDSGQRYVREVGRFSAWLYQQEIALISLNEKIVQRYMQDRWRGLRCRPRGSPFFLLFCYMRDQGLIHMPVVPISHGSTEYWLLEFRAYLSNECGFAGGTIRRNIRIARKFIEFRFKQGVPDFQRLCATDTLKFAKECAHGCSRGYIQLQMSALRKFLMFLYLKGAVSEGLADGIPSVPVLRQASLPSYLKHQEVERMLQTSRRQKESVLRNHAILLLLVRLGLRAIEVQRLRLDDIHWADGWLAIQGKGGIEQRLPMSEEVGDAISHYVRDERPTSATRSVFIRTNAPHRGFSSSSAVAHIARKALADADLSPSQKGSHIMRRTCATLMLQKGISLADIGQILRHRRPDTTAIYAKVDQHQLLTYAAAWPGGHHE